jgi:ribosomal protein S18 acetylase RimI-like enzyme
MKVMSLHSQQEIEAFLRSNPFLHLYCLGDLDDFFWPYTTWYALKDQQQITQLALLYTGTSLPTLLGLTEEPTDQMRELLQSILHLLPIRLYTHLSGDLATVFADDYHVHSHGAHYKMGLVHKAQVETIDTAQVVQLSSSDVDELEALYHVSYPGNWFDPRMLETGCYYGIRQKKELVSVAGIHVYSPHYKVAALGNVTTHPAYRGQGLATIVCAKLCQSLLQTVDYIGLNVKADNVGAIHSYERLGFEYMATYEECSLERK